MLAEPACLAPTSEAQVFWAESARGAIDGKLDLHAWWLTAGGGVHAATFDAEPAPATVAYLDYLRAAAFVGNHTEIIAALLPCFWLYTDLGQRLHSGEFGDDAGDPRHPCASWLATYADPAFEKANQRVIGYVTGVAAAVDAETRARMLRAFEASSRHELAFFAAPLDGTP